MRLMNSARFKLLLRMYRRMFDQHGIPSERQATDASVDVACSLAGPVSTVLSASHVRWMCDEVDHMYDREGETEKVQRWLGFIQGVMWATGLYTIDELRGHVTTLYIDGESYMPHGGYEAGE